MPLKFHIGYLILILSSLIGKSQDKDTLLKRYMDSASYYASENQNQHAYNSALKAYTLLKEQVGGPSEKIGGIQSDLGTYAFRMGNVSLSADHHRKAIQIFRSLKQPSYRHLYLSGNNMGSIMWMSSKIDSASFYFNIALEAVAKMEATPQNKYYRPAVLQNNLAGVYGAQGKTAEAIAAMKSTIENLRMFLAIKEPQEKRNDALHFQFEATDNLAGIYKELGDYQQAKVLLEHSYKQKQLQLQPGNADVFKSEILLGQLYYAMKEFNRSEQMLNSGLNHFQQADGDYLFWQADGYNTLALLADERRDAEKAAIYYEKADQLYEASLQGEYDDIYLEFLRNAALFYAQQQNAVKALAKANKGYRYVVGTQGKQTLLYFYQLLSMGEIQFELHNYKEASKYSEQALLVVNRMISSGQTWIDSVKMELKKPKALLLAAKSRYAIQPKDTATLLSMLRQVREGLLLIEKRKALLHDEKDLTLLLADQSDLLEFIKQLTLDLYNITGNISYADQLISLHESGLYNRIRSRLNKTDTVKFANVPASVLEEEKRLTKAFSLGTAIAGTHDQQMQYFLKAEEKRNLFLQDLKVRYPSYYNLKYTSIFKPLELSSQSIPINTTIVRYLFAGKQLVAYVVNQQHKKFFLLNGGQLAAEIQSLSENAMDAVKMGEVLQRLYKRLWEPIAGSITSEKVVIVPDGLLYHLNFELLTRDKITSFEQLSIKSLLAKHAISYQYSLFLINPTKQASPGSNFVAFAPGFMDPLKEDYRKSAGDRKLDNAYLSLLPQPFTLDVASKHGRILNGAVYSHSNSTLPSFKEHAGHHKIIYIGTHAESNNLSPQFSRLIFAKDTLHKEQENSLYLFDIYNCDLSSDLTVLTACESGKVGYEDGEGMISLSHAFHYAGSKSMLTGLWKIDEQASAVLVDQFYEYLQQGMSKDEALRQAKLRYLATSTGRTLAPQYWAGLVLMGDTSPVLLKQSFLINYGWILGTVVLLIISLFIWIGFKRRTQR